MTACIERNARLTTYDSKVSPPAALQGARLLFPIGWLAGSVVAQIRPEEREHFAAACGIIRRNGACDVTFERAEI